MNECIVLSTKVLGVILISRCEQVCLYKRNLITFLFQILLHMYSSMFNDAYNI